MEWKKICIWNHRNVELQNDIKNNTEKHGEEDSNVILLSQTQGLRNIIYLLPGDLGSSSNDFSLLQGYEQRSSFMQ